MEEVVKAYQRKVLTDMLMVKLTEAKEEICEELVKVLKALKIDIASVFDKIPAEVLKELS